MARSLSFEWDLNEDVRNLVIGLLDPLAALSQEIYN